MTLPPESEPEPAVPTPPFELPEETPVPPLTPPEPLAPFTPEELIEKTRDLLDE